MRWKLLPQLEENSATDVKIKSSCLEGKICQIQWLQQNIKVAVLSSGQCPLK